MGRWETVFPYKFCHIIPYVFLDILSMFCHIIWLYVFLVISFVLYVLSLYILLFYILPFYVLSLNPQSWAWIQRKKPWCQPNLPLSILIHLTGPETLLDHGQGQQRLLSDDPWREPQLLLRTCWSLRQILCQPNMSLLSCLALSKELQRMPPQPLLHDDGDLPVWLPGHLLRADVSDDVSRLFRTTTCFRTAADGGPIILRFWQLIADHCAKNGQKRGATNWPTLANDGRKMTEINSLIFANSCPKTVWCNIKR